MVCCKCLSSLVASFWTRRISLGFYETELQLRNELSHLEREYGQCLHSGQGVGHLGFPYCFEVSNYKESKKNPSDELHHLWILWLQGIATLQHVSLPLMLSSLNGPWKCLFGTADKRQPLVSVIGCYAVSLKMYICFAFALIQIISFYLSELLCVLQLLPSGTRAFP